MFGSVYEQLSYNPNSVMSKRLRHFGFKHYCPICHSFTSGFGHFGRPRRENAKCEVCGSLERHRLIWYYLQSLLKAGNSAHYALLHLAPLPIIKAKLNQLKHVHYVTGDFIDPDVNFHFDVTQIPLDSEYFDLVLCSHILEHIPDDTRAMREIFRILVPGGRALFMVPMNRSTTLEAIEASAEERQILFDNPYHVRDYGWDIITRLESCGFKVEVLHPRDILTPLQAVFASPPHPSDYIFVGHKPVLS